MFNKKKNKTKAPIFSAYRHWRDPLGEVQGAITFRFSVDQEKEQLVFSWALCSPQDNFCRATGRKLADQRFDSGKRYSCWYDRKQSLVENALNELATREWFLSNRAENKTEALRTERDALSQLVSTAKAIGVNKSVDYWMNTSLLGRIVHIFTGFRPPGIHLSLLLAEDD